MSSQGSDAARGGREIRASDAEREQVVEQLREHFGAGRLSQEELSARVEAAYGSGTLRDLEVLTLDLPDARQGLRPAEQRPPAPRKPQSKARRALWLSFRIHLTVYVLVNVLLIGIWAASGGGYFWPVWPALGWGIGVLSHVGAVSPKRRFS